MNIERFNPVDDRFEECGGQILEETDNIPTKWICGLTPEGISLHPPESNIENVWCEMSFGNSGISRISNHLDPLSYVKNSVSPLYFSFWYIKIEKVLPISLNHFDFITGHIFYYLVIGYELSWFVYE